MESSSRGRVAADDRPLVHSLPEAARLLGKSWRTVKAMIARGELTALELNGRHVVPAHALDALIGVPPPAAPTAPAPADGVAASGAVSAALRQIGDGFALLADALAAQDARA